MPARRRALMIASSPTVRQPTRALRETHIRRCRVDRFVSARLVDSWKTDEIGLKLAIVRVARAGNRFALHEGMRSASASSRGFTLIEVVIVAGVIGIISAIAVPTLFRARMTGHQ